MQVNKKNAKLIKKVINNWEKENVITTEQATKLQASLEVLSFDWKRMAKYSFWISIICMLISISSVLLDETLMELIKRFLKAPPLLNCMGLGLTASLIFTYGLKRKASKPQKIYSNEAILFMGIIFVAGSIFYFGKAIDTGSGHVSILILLATVLYSALGLWFRSGLIWIVSLLCLGSWFGAETGYVSGWGAYFLGMNYPLRFVFLGAVLVIVSQVAQNFSLTRTFYKSTYVISSLYLFIALWILSIFGNYGDMVAWHEVKQIELFWWALLFGLIAIGFVAYGLKKDDAIAKGFGLTFLFINLYTRYFEYCWKNTHKALFFAILAITFWLIGSKAEKIWNLKIKKPE